MDGDVLEAVARSHLADLPEGAIGRLLDGSRAQVLRPGDVLHWSGEETALLVLVVRGVLRVRVGAPDGRTMTVRYCRPGSLLGAMSLFLRGFAMPATVETLTEARLLRIDPDAARALARRDTGVVRALHVERAERAEGFLPEIPGGVFGTIRQRVVRHLLDLATERPATGTGLSRLVVGESQTVRQVAV